MTESAEMVLPSSGLAEDILANFIDTAQLAADGDQTRAKKDEREILFHLVTFRIGNEEYGIEINQVQEIIRAKDITPVPGAPDHVKGVINLRGKIIPVVEMRKRFGMAEAEATDAQRIVVVELGDKRLGILVDSVFQVIKLPSSVIEEIPAEATTVDEHYIKGVGKMEDRLVIILDLNRSLLLA